MIHSNFHRHALGCALFFLLPLLPGRATDLHVSPEGDDNNDGGAEQPFRTLRRAQLRVRELNGDMEEDIVVHLAEGVYTLTRPLVFDAADSGTNGHQVIYRGPDAPARAVLKGSVPVTGWRPFRDGIWVAPVHRLPHLHTLYVDGDRVRKARHPNHVHNPDFPTAQAPYLKSEDGLPKGRRRSGTTTSWIQWREGDLDMPLAPLGQMRINIFPWGKADWHRWICKVTQVDERERILRFDNLGDATEILGRARYFLEDSMRFLDAPGEFFRDESTGMLYLFPPEGGNPNQLNVEAPVVMDLIRLEGVTPEGNVRNLVFDSLTLENTGGLSPVLHWWTRQWGRTDHALIWMLNTRDVVVRNCHLRNSGRHGILMLGGAVDNRVEGCEVERTGVSGISIVNRFRDLEGAVSRGNIVTGNRVHNVGQLSLYASCVTVFSSSDNRVVDNDLHDSPRYAITVRGNTLSEQQDMGYDEGLPPASGNLFRDLRIRDCGQDSGDMGAVHVAGVNLKGGPHVNTFENIHIRNVRAVPGMEDYPPNGIFLDWPDRTMGQVFRDVRIENTQGEGVRSNKKGNLRATRFENVTEDGEPFTGRRRRKK